MDFSFKKKQIRMVFPGIALAVFLFSFAAYKIIATENTNIDSVSKYAWSENGGWLNFRSDGTLVEVEDDKLTGYVWSENLGWISLNCENDSSCATVDYGVANDGNGNLSGYAWGENIGWVNFAPSNGGVSVDSDGIFSGTAWGENIGWVVFNCSDLDACGTSSFKVKTDWTPDDGQDDSDDEAGQTEVSNVKYSTTDTSLVITWKTNHNADSRVRWGKDKNLSEERKDDENVKKHRIVLKDIESDTVYYFRVKSVDGNGQEDTSRIHSVSTKAASSFFAKASAGISEPGEKEPEEVKIEVRDKTEKEKQSDTREQSAESKPEEDNSENSGQIVENRDETKTPKGPSAISRAVSFTGSFLASAAKEISSGIHDLALSGQRKIAGFFGWTGEKIAGVYTSAVSLFNREKAGRIAQIKQAKFYTTQVFKRDEKKILAEVRFQILDKSENPIPELETMLFSDPQSSVTDENGIAAFKDVPIGQHTLAFEYQDENFEKKVDISDTLTEEGKVRAEIVAVKAAKEKIALWMWGMMALLFLALAAAAYFAKKYYSLKKQNDGKIAS